jgi:demethylmenaquinone methyltransferase/2-methoxy-6-polyprenyl-1,4-benzoquinol methylase
MRPVDASASDRLSDELYDKLAPAYDAMNSDMSAGADDRWRRHALAFVPMTPDTRAVDLGTGTGEFYLLLCQAIGPAGSVVGLDRSAEMLKVARTKAQQRLPGRDHDLRQMTSYDTGLSGNSVDLITLGWVLRSVGDRQALYREAFRILRPGGALMSLEAFDPGLPPLRWVHDVWMRIFMDRRMRRHTGNDRALFRFVFSDNHFPTKRGLAQEWRQAGFRVTTARTIAVGIAVHVGLKPDDHV